MQNTIKIRELVPTYGLCRNFIKKILLYITYFKRGKEVTDGIYLKEVPEYPLLILSFFFTVIFPYCNLTFLRPRMPGPRECLPLKEFSCPGDPEFAVLLLGREVGL